MSHPSKITAPDDPSLEELCQQLAERSGSLDRTGHWPGEQLRLCGQYGVYEWFLPEEWGGQAWSELDVVRGYLKLSAGCLTTTFIITQRTGACQRIAHGENEACKHALLPDLLRGTSFATVGISHLTTSRRHLTKTVLRARRNGNGFVLDGFSPWVTGGAHAQTIVVGATLEGEPSEEVLQMLVALPTNLPGVTVPKPAELVGLTASHTGEVRLEDVRIGGEHILAGPIENVMASGVGAGTGGLQTSTLAVGVASSAIDYLEQEAAKRDELVEAFQHLRSEYQTVEADLLALAAGQDVCSGESLRKRANSLVLRTAEAALAAAKGTGYVVGHPAGRWCREALFFLVWSCPRPVLAANLCELAGIEG